MILFTERELEPYDTYARTKLEFEIDDLATDFTDMAEVTDLVFFQDRRRNAAAVEGDPPAADEAAALTIADATPHGANSE